MAVPPRHSDEKPTQQEDAAPGSAAPADTHEPHADAPDKPKPAEPQGKIMPEKSEFFPADNPAVTKHIDVLQGIINRLANNSASCKTWCLTLTGALLSLAGATKVPALAVFVIVPILIFRYVDMNYLATERAYRGKYNTIIGLIQNGTYTRVQAFSAGVEVTADDERHARKSWSVKWVYGPLIALYVVYLILWFVDWQFGCFGGFFALPSAAAPPAVK